MYWENSKYCIENVSFRTKRIQHIMQMTYTQNGHSTFQKIITNQMYVDGTNRSHSSLQIAMELVKEALDSFHLLTKKN